MMVASGKETCVCVCVCVCERDRERERERESNMMQLLTDSTRIRIRQQCAAFEQMKT